MAARKPKKKKPRVYRSIPRRSRLLGPVMRRLGKHVRELRHDKGISQETAAEIAEMETRQWQAIEAGSKNVTLASLLAIARCLGVSLSQLLEGAYPRIRITSTRGAVRRAK